MKTLSRRLMICAVLSAGILGLHLLGSDAYAAEGTSHWRPIYDVIMRWINFVLSFLWSTNMPESRL